MCMIIGEEQPIHVSNTNIFVGKLYNGDQFTVYSNQVKSQNKINDNWFVNRMKNEPMHLPSNNNNNIAMVLPYPKGNVKLYNMQDCEDIFSKLKEYFPEPQTQNAVGYGLKSDSLTFNNSIKVEKIGGYDVSVVPSLDDFNRLQYDVFNLDKGFQNLLQRDYSKDYGFIVCKLRDSEKFHPIAYSHPMRSDGELFIPTKHYHNGSESNADWDHSIYILNGNININNKGIFSRVFNTSSIKAITPFTTDKVHNISKIDINNRFKENYDFLVKVV